MIIDRIKRPEGLQERSTVADAAKALGVSRQAVYDILKGKYCPSIDLIRRACDAWSLEFEFRGMRIEKAVLPSLTGGNAVLSSEAQMNLDLVEATRQIDHRSFEVLEAKPVGRFVEIKIRLTIPA